jgi:peptide/nickel transport system permease protein
VIAYIARRIGQSLLTLVAISMVLFLLLKLYGGDPGWIMLGHMATLAKVHALDRALGVFEPWPVQYLDWIRQLFAGGLSSMFSVLPPTILLFALGGGLGLILAILLAIAQARHPGRWIDHLTSAGSLLFYALPSFWLGMVLFLIFAVELEWLPLVPPGFAPGGEGPLGWSLAMVLPVVSLALTSVATWSMHLRAAMEEALASDYVRTARAKGLPEYLVVRRHVLRHALLPLLTMIGMSFPVLLSNLIVLQMVFGMYGIGGLLETAIFARLFGLLLNTVFVIGVITIAANLIVDILAVFADPRIRFG